MDGSGTTDQGVEPASEASSQMSTPGADTLSSYQHPDEPAEPAGSLEAASDSVNNMVSSNTL